MYGFGGHTLELTVVACYNLRDTEWISRQDPYVCIEYANATYSTRTCVDGNRNPTFRETFNITLVEGYREISVSVWNKNVLMPNYLIGTGKTPLDNVLLNGHEDSTWPLQYKSMRGGEVRHAGEIRLAMNYHRPNVRHIRRSVSCMPSHNCARHYSPEEVPMEYAPFPAPNAYPPPHPAPYPPPPHPGPYPPPAYQRSAHYHQPSPYNNPAAYPSPMHPGYSYPPY